MANRTAYITTPIYYVNDKPHIGHVYTTTLADVWARFMRLDDRDVFFLTGTDEHGVKVQKSAEERGITPQEIADENAAVFRNVFERMEFTHDHFIRTTDADHERQVQIFVQRLVDSGAVELGEFEGWYDAGEEEYYTETKAKDHEYTSPVSGRPLVRATEKNYYFRLSLYQERLEAHFAANPHFVRPDGRRNEVLGRLREGLQDVPMSRTNFTWGVPMPGDPEHVIYVWIDALMNYATALGLAEPDSDCAKARAGYWPAEYHVIGKEILWFHAVIWPAMLMALELPLPTCVYAHSFWISEGKKMSKSLGNFVDLETIDRYLDAYGRDSWRYYLVTQGPLGATDSDLSAAHFHDVHNTDLVNTVGNCASRVTAMITRYRDGVVPSESPDGTRREIAERDWPQVASVAVQEVRRAMDAFDLAGAASAAMGLIRKVDAFINETAPFKLAKETGREAELDAILYQCLEAVRIASILLAPLMPDKMAELWSAIGVEVDPSAGGLTQCAQWGGLEPGTTITKVALFPRVEKALAVES